MGIPVIVRNLTRCLSVLVLLAAGMSDATLRARAGTSVATITVPQEISPSWMVFDAHTSHLFVATIAQALQPREQSWVTMIDVRSARVLRHTPVGLGAPLLAFDPLTDRVYVTGVISPPPRIRSRAPVRPARTTYRVVALDGVTGAIVGMTEIGSQGAGIGVDESLGHLFVAGGGAGWCTRRTCYTEPNIVTILDARTLKSLASTPVGSSPQGDLLVDDRNHRVYVSTGDGVDVLDARSAKLLLRIPLSASIRAIDQATNRVILTDYQGDLLLLDGRTSQVLAALRQPSPIEDGFPGTSMAVDPRSGAVSYAAAQVSTSLSASFRPVRLYQVNGMTGRILYSCPLAAHPSAIVAAPRSGEVIVTDSGTNTATVIRTAGCTVVQRIHVASTPVNIAVDAENNLVVIGSNMRQASMPLSGNTVTPATTIVAIDWR